MLTQERLKEVLHYDPETGVFTWIKSPNPNRVKNGSIAGCLNGACYRVIRIDAILYRAGRLAWLYVHGYLPIEVDHEDKQPWNDTLTNLREATSQQNKTNRSGWRDLPKGVRRHYNRFAVGITYNYSTIHLGVFDTVEEAGEAYTNAAKKLFGEFACDSKTS